MKRLFALAGLALAALVLPAHAQSADDQYVGIYNLIQQADSLNSSGQPAEALPKFLEAQSALQILQKQYPEWQVKVVKFRLNYLAAKIADLTGKVPAPAAPTATDVPGQPGVKPPVTVQVPGKPAAPSETERQLAALQDEVRQLQGDKAVLEAKLKEALATQPAAADPSELAKAQEKIQSLMKENDLLKASMTPDAATPVQGAAPKTLQAAKKALAEANRELAAQTESAAKLALEKDALQARVVALNASAGAADALRAENELLKKQVADLKSAPPATTGDADAARQLAQAQAQIAALQSDAEVLRLEKLALQDRVKQLSAAPAPATVVRSPNLPEDAERIRQLERERDGLEKKLEAMNRELYGRKGREVGARVDELSGEIATIRARLEVFEARAVPYTAEELALFKPATTRLAVADPNAGRKSVKALPADTRVLVMEADRDFSTGQFDKAEAKYLEILRQDDKNPLTLANLAAIQLELNHLDEAEKHVKQALAAVPEDGYSLSILGYLKFRQEKYDDALDALSRSAKLDPESARTQNYLGVTLAHKGMRKPAETALRKAIQLDPGYGEAHNNLAVVYATPPHSAVELARWHYQKALAAGHPRNTDLEKMLDQKSGANGSP